MSLNFEQTFHDRQHQFIHTATEILGMEEDAEDCVQEAWCQAWALRDRVVSPGYIKIAVKHQAIDRLRRIRPQFIDDLCTYDEDGHEVSTPPELVDGRTERDLISRSSAQFLLDHSGPRVKMLLRDYYMAELTPLQIAKKYGMTEGSVKVSIQRAKRKLRKKYGNTKI